MTKNTPARNIQAKPKKAPAPEKPAPRYMEHPDGGLRLLNGATDTGIAVRRSHEGYSHFACWHVTDGGKIKKSFPLNEKNAALAKGTSLYFEKLGSEILRKHGRGKNG